MCIIFYFFFFFGRECAVGGARKHNLYGVMTVVDTTVVQLRVAVISAKYGR